MPTPTPEYLNARGLLITAVDTLDTWQGQPTLTSQIAGAGTITQAQYDAVVVARDAAIAGSNARQAAITAMKAAAQADLNADAASVAGQGVLTAAGTF